MAILVDYRCSGCGHLEERWAPTPPPVSVCCSSCGDDSRRAWAPIGLSGTTAPSLSEPPSAPAGPSLASRYPQLPGLCHMSESAGQMWVAKAKGDNRAVEAELAKQEKRATVKAPTMQDVVAHPH